MLSVLNFKKFERGSMIGFFDLRYHGLTIKGCRLMAGSNGKPTWFSFPQIKGEQDGETKYFDLMFLSSPEREHVRAAIVAELVEQGQIPERGKPSNPAAHRSNWKTPEAEDLSDYRSSGMDDDIPF